MTKASSESIWLERVLAWRQSGCSAAQFCEDKAFHPSSLLSWSSRLGREGKVPALARGRRRGVQASETGLSFVRVVTRAATAPQPSAAVVVAIGGSRIEVTSDFDPALLRAVVEALTVGAR
jgi:hypothetical protein